MYSYTCCVDNLKYIHYILFTLVDFIYCYMLCVYLLTGLHSEGSKAGDKPIKFVSAVKCES